MVDTRDLKSLDRKVVWVQVPPGVQKVGENPAKKEFFEIIGYDLSTSYKDADVQC